MTQRRVKWLAFALIVLVLVVSHVQWRAQLQQELNISLTGIRHGGETLIAERALSRRLATERARTSPTASAALKRTAPTPMAP